MRPRIRSRPKKPCKCGARMPVFALRPRSRTFRALSCSDPLWGGENEGVLGARKLDPVDRRFAACKNQQAEARERRADGATIRELAESYNVGKSTIARVARATA